VRENMNVMEMRLFGEPLGVRIFVLMMLFVLKVMPK